MTSTPAALPESPPTAGATPPPSPDPPYLRRLACCASEPPCILCPLLPENAHRSLKDLAEAGLRANL